MINKYKTDENYRENLFFKNTNNKNFTSRGEIKIREYFKNNFKEDEWTFGGCLKIDENLYISRDLYSKKLKINFEYDGIFHFKNIYGQLENKQLKDNKLEEWSIKNEWRLIRISDDIFILDEDF